MLPIVAAMVMGGLARQTSAGGAGAGPSAGFGPGSGAGAGGGGLLDMLSPMLDQNRNGSPLDDILGMAASFLGRR
jgi:hypothetical protein